MNPRMLATLAFPALLMAASAAPRLVVSTPSLAPESTIDLVFDSPVIETAAIGSMVEGRLLDISPPLPGKLRWKAQNIAAWVPDEMPKISTSYTFSLNSGSKHLDGTPIPPGKIATIESERFRMVDCDAVGNTWSSDYSASAGSWLVVFNDAVDPAAASAFIAFEAAGGKRVAAILERPALKDAGYRGRAQRPWNARGRAEEPDPSSPATHVLLVRPASPLPAAKGWRLSIGKGLPHEGGGARLAEDSPWGIGDIAPFQVQSIDSRTVADEPRTIVIRFNHPLPAQLPPDFLGQTLSIAPRPATLEAKPEGRTIEITGDLLGADKYRVSVGPGFVSRDGLPMADPSAKEIEFKHLRPGIALPSTDEGQLAEGRREYRLHSLNLESMRVRIKQLSGTDLVRAFQGYRTVSGVGPDGNWIEPNAPLPWSLILGPQLADLEIPLGNPIDTTKTATLEWNRILPMNQRHAVLFVEATGKPHPAARARTGPVTQAIVQLTDIGLAWKLTPTEALVYAFSCQSGQPIQDARIQVFGEDATPLAQASTDAAGLARLPRESASRHLQASLDGDQYVTAFDQTLDTVGLWHFPVRYAWDTPPEARRQAFLFTDRSLYRPGETVRLKGILRTLRGNEVAAHEGGPARIVIVDPTDKEIASLPITISPAGSFDCSHRLAASQVGTHAVRLEFPEELARAEAARRESRWADHERTMAGARVEIPLRVQEFRRNAFELTQKIADPAIGATTLGATLTAKYYQGQPVASGKVKHYSRIVSGNPYPERFRDFLFGNHRTSDWGYWFHYFGYEGGDTSRPSSSLQGEMQLDASGNAAISVPLPESEFPSQREVLVSSEVTDANLQTLTTQSTAVVHPAALYLGVSRIDRLVRAGEELPLKVVAVDTAGKPFNQAVTVSATLTREVHSTVKTQTANGTTTRDEVTEETVLASEFTLDPSASAKEGHSLVVTPRATGLHYLTLRGKDPDGRPFATTVNFQAYGTREYPWLYEDGMRVKLVAEKQSWTAGETARVLVLSPIEGTALVTVEREKVLRTFSVELKADRPVIEVPITEDDAPNVFVSVLVVKGAKDSARVHKQPQLRLGYCELIVENRRDRLAVAVDTPSESHRPGEEVTLSGTVSGADGKPVAGAEVTLYAEDEGTLAVGGYDTPQPLAFFYEPRLLAVNTGTSFESFLPEDPSQQSFHNKGFFVGGGGGDAWLADLLRKNFDPCATWAPALVTDAAGRFSHGFRLPDTLTRYRVIAVAHHETRRFGHAESAIVARKDLMLEPKVPRFAHQTDTLQPQVLVQNASRHAGTWKIEFNAHAASGNPICLPQAVTSQLVSLAPGASATLPFPVIAQATGEAVLSWQAVPVALENAVLAPELAKRLSDAVEARFPVHYPMPLIRQVKFARLDGPPDTLAKSLDPKLLAGTGTLDLEFSSSPLAEVAGSVEFLLHYPYGCVEQTTSSLIPWCAVRDLKGVVPAFAEVSEEKVRAALQGGVDRLLTMLRPDGSFSYWPAGRDAVDWATPYAAMGLLRAAQQGAIVPQAALDSITNHLVGSLRGMATDKSPFGLETHARSLLVLAMAGKAQTAYQNTMVERLADLSPGARAMLATSFAIQQAPDHATARAILTSDKPPRLENDSWMPWSPDRALEVLAWTSIDPKGPEALKAIDRLLRERNPYGHWRTTWVNGWSLLAMASYAATLPPSGESIAVRLETRDGAEAIQLTPEQPVATRRLALGTGFQLAASSAPAACVRAVLASKPAVQPLQPVAHNGLAIDRIHQRVNPDGSTEPLTEPRPGDLVRVTLRVTLPRDDTRYLVIEDPLPAIFETVNEDFASQKAALGIATSQSDWNVSHSELRDDRAVFFLDQVARRGTYTLSYLARCTLAGQATAPPAKVESMYDPDQHALSASRVFTAK